MLRTPGDETLSLEALGRLVPSIPYGISIAVFYDADSDWLPFADSLVASSLKAASLTGYITYTRLPSDIRIALAGYVPDLRRHELSESLRDRPVEERAAQRTGSDAAFSFFIVDSYSWVTGKVAKGEYSAGAGEVNLATLSATIAKETSQNPPGTCIIEDSNSPVVLHSEEKSFLKFFRTRLGRAKIRREISFVGFAADVHTPAFYAMIGASVDGVMEVRHRDVNDELHSFVRVRNLRNVAHDRRWLKIVQDGQGRVSLAEKT